MGKETTIGVPTARGMGSAFADYGIGLVGGLVYGLVQGILGKGILGSLAAPLAAGTVVKGTRGTVLATMAGYEAGRDLGFGGLGNIFGGNSGNAGGSTQRAVI